MKKLGLLIILLLLLSVPLSFIHAETPKDSISISTLSKTTEISKVNGITKLKVEPGTYSSFLTIENRIDAVEYSWVLPSRPPTNTFTLKLTFTNCEYYYQPALNMGIQGPNWVTVNATHALDKSGKVLAYRPIDIVGSYAVYGVERNGIYGMGKVAHIYRPLVYDSAGSKIWGVMNIVDDILTVTVDQKWLDTAKYPVTIDPTFGSTNAGASNLSDQGDYLQGTQVTTPAAPNIRISKFTAYIKASDAGSCGFKAGVWINANGGAVVGVTEPGSSVSINYAWRDAAYATPLAVSSSTTYLIGFIAQLQSPYIIIAYDSGGTSRRDVLNSYASPGVFDWSDSNTYILSLYATYTSAPSITSAVITDMDDGNNLYAMKGYYTFTTVVADADYTSSWVEVSPNLSESEILSLAVYNGKLYGGTVPNGKLYEWNGVDAWTQVAPKLGNEMFILSLAVYNNKLYGGTFPGGKLYEWNGINAWVLRAPTLGEETYITSLVVYNNKLYGGTASNGKLYEWNDVDSWVEVAPKLGTEVYISSLAVYNGKLYGGTCPNGKLYEWNGVNAWVEKAPQLGSEVGIWSLAVYNNKLYGGTYPNGKLYEWNGVNAWVLRAPKLGDETDIYSLAVYNGKLYGGTAPNGKLYEWNGVNAWVERASTLGTEDYIFSLAVYNGKLYGGTAPTGMLYEWNYITDLKNISIRGTQGASVRWMVNATDLDSTPAYTITVGGSVIDLNTASCTFSQLGNDGTLVLKIGFEWDTTNEADCELEVWAQDSTGYTAGWTTVQTNYFDVINRLVTLDLTGNKTSVIVGGKVMISGYVRYAMSPTSNNASISYPPDAQFTGVKIHDGDGTYYGIDSTVTNGYFSVNITAPASLGTKLFYAYLDLLPDYTDGFAPDGDYAVVSVISNFVPSQVINQGFAYFGVLDAISGITTTFSAFGAHFYDSITIIVSSTLMLIGMVLGAGIFLIDWGTRIVLLVMNITGFIVDLWNGAASISTGLGNLTTFFGVGQWIDIIPVFILIGWIMSIDDREKKTGRNFLEISIGDIQTAYSLLSIITGVAWTIYNTVVDITLRFLSII